MSEKKVVRRSVAIALGIICIIFIAGLGGVMAYYSMVVNDKNTTYGSYVSSHSHTDSDYNSLQSAYNNYVSSHSHTNSEYDSLSSQNTNLQNQVNDLTGIVNLAKSTIWVNQQTVSQPAGSYSEWTFSATYAGYISVVVYSSTTSNTGVRVIYSSHGASYDNQIGVGTGGTAVFPILPASIHIRVGNSNWLNGATETVTVTYYY